LSLALIFPSKRKVCESSADQTLFFPSFLPPNRNFLPPPHNFSPDGRYSLPLSRCCFLSPFLQNRNVTGELSPNGPSPSLDYPHSASALLRFMIHYSLSTKTFLFPSFKYHRLAHFVSDFLSPIHLHVLIFFFFASLDLLTRCVAFACSQSSILYGTLLLFPGTPLPVYWLPPLSAPPWPLPLPDPCTRFFFFILSQRPGVGKLVSPLPVNSTLSVCPVPPYPPLHIKSKSLIFPSFFVFFFFFFLFSLIDFI